jgi:glyoxylase-like metal-dependent hydrolase (beta-lactamase superfamily II)
MHPSGILNGLWCFEAVHPEWTEEEGGEDGWEPVVAWYAVATGRGLLLIDPLVSDWEEIDQMMNEHGGCAGVVRTIHWHQRTVAEAASRYRAEVWAGHPPNDPVRGRPLDHEVGDGDELWDGIRAFAMERDDEIALWLPAQAALVFGDAMLRRQTGELRVCPDSWTQPADGPARLRAVLGGLTRLPVEHVLVSHGPLVVGDGFGALRAALDR